MEICCQSLTWYLKGQNLTCNRTGVNNFTTELYPDNNGKEFICTAYSPALPIPLTCSVIPYNVFPKATLPPAKITMSPNNVTVVCENVGNATSDTFYKWYLKKSELNEPMINIGIAVSTWENISTLKVTGAIPNATIITCIYI